MHITAHQWTAIGDRDNEQKKKDSKVFATICLFCTYNVQHLFQSVIRHPVAAVAKLCEECTKWKLFDVAERELKSHLEEKAVLSGASLDVLHTNARWSAEAGRGERRLPARWRAQPGGAS